MWLIGKFGELCGHFYRNFDENRKNQLFQFSPKIFITSGVFGRFCPNLVCIISVGVPKILMRAILIFAFLPFLWGFEHEKWPFTRFLTRLRPRSILKNENFKISRIRILDNPLGILHTKFEPN